jgi:hypothetical protein
MITRSNRRAVRAQLRADLANGTRPESEQDA